LPLVHFIRAVVLVGIAATAASAQGVVVPNASKFLVLLRSAQIGTEEIAVTQNASGWTITSAGRIGAPLDLVTKMLQIRYDPDWKPIDLNLDATARNQPIALQISVNGTSATSRLTSGGQTTDNTHTIDPAALLMPNPFFAAYEGVAARLRTAPAGTLLPAYQGVATPVTIRVGDSQEDRIQTAARFIVARRTHVTFTSPGVPEVEADVWGDEAGRLLRLSVPVQGIEFVRDDVASVSSRHVVISRGNDQQVRIPANGFTLAGTVSLPSGGSGGRLPAVILVSGSGQLDRDETVAGIPIMGQLAGGLADAGFVVLRYDKRGIGQSGGRPEAAGLAEYAEDLRAAVAFLAKRKDVDEKRIAAAGHSEGGSVALLAGTKERRIAAIVLMAAPGIPGDQVILAQQQRLLNRSTMSEDEKQAKIDLQKRIHEAVLTGQGWEALPAEMRRQADTPGFRSLLTYDPAKVMPDVRQPLLILQPSLDAQVEPSNADRLEELARGRKRMAPVEVAKLPGINHLLVPATTGEVDEYGSLAEKEISSVVPRTISEWLLKTLPAAAR
jgi:alpha-beta hydrolase superfamily lysophospholipase